MNQIKKMFPLRSTVAFIAILLTVVSLQAQSQTNAPSTSSEERVLLVVETSAAMQKRTENVQKLVGEMFSSGLGGDMRSGDSVGMWTFNVELRTGQFPLKRWTKPTRQRVAVEMVQFLQQVRNEKTAHLAVIWETLTNIVSRSERITVVIISSGSEAITGTPFDESIAQNFLKNEETQRKAKMPFVTILRAYRGAFVNFSVNLPPWPMELPEYPREARRPAEAIVKKEVEADAAAAALPSLIVNGNDSNSASPLTNATIYATNIPAPEVVTKPSETNVVVSTVTNEIAVATVKSKVETNASRSPELKTSAVTNDESKLPSKTILAGAIALLAVVIVVLMALLRSARRSTGESLITRTMNKKDE